MTIRALTIHQPFANQIMTGKKRIEYRSWSTRYRGPLLIHAAKISPEKAADKLLARSAILGTVELFDIRAEDGDWEWMLRNPLPFAVPIPCAGNLGLWAPSPELLAAMPVNVQELAALPQTLAPPSKRKPFEFSSQGPPLCMAECDRCHKSQRFVFNAYRHVCTKCKHLFPLNWKGADGKGVRPTLEPRMAPSDADSPARRRERKPRPKSEPEHTPSKHPEEFIGTFQCDYCRTSQDLSYYVPRIQCKKCGRWNKLEWDEE